MDAQLWNNSTSLPMRNYFTGNGLMVVWKKKKRNERIEKQKQKQKEKQKQKGKKKNRKRIAKVEQGRIHGNTVADGWAGAVMQKPLAIQKYFGRTDVPTYRPTR